MTGKFEKKLKASCVSESGDSSRTGISTRYLGCRCFFNFLVGREIGLLRGFCKVVERQVLAWEMASSLVKGGEYVEDASWVGWKEQVVSLHNGFRERGRRECIREME